MAKIPLTGKHKGASASAGVPRRAAPSRGVPRYAGVLILTALVFSCATRNEVYRDIDANVARDAYTDALSIINKRHSAIYPKKNKVLLHLDKGILEHYAGNYKNSSADLEAADELIERYFAKSITQSATSFIANDNVKDYAGEEYENIYLNVFNALNYYHAGKFDDALVEIRRVNEKLLQLEDKYAKAIEKAKKADEKYGRGVKSGERARFNNSALARYLGALLYRADGRQDDARIDFAAIETAYKTAPNVYPFSCAEAFKAKGEPGYETGPELQIPRGKARLNVIAFTGLGPYKEEENTIIPLPLPAPNNFARIALPRLVNRPSSVSRVSVSVSGAGNAAFNLDLLEDLGLAAAETFKASYGLTVVKTSMRSIIKQTVGAGLAGAAEEQGGSALGLLVGIATTIANTASEQADTRISRYLPRYAFAGGINLDPGEYTVRISFTGGNIQEKTIKVKAGALNLIEAFYLH
ncbi:MAG: hypothetical protein LBG72_08890 [Spirochaetaceae bacterium]|jgi:hypothetical protein|nr:hypothetical protein [Spirochaetaceae bacterium]